VLLVLLSVVVCTHLSGDWWSTASIYWQWRNLACPWILVHIVLFQRSKRILWRQLLKLCALHHLELVLRALNIFIIFVSKHHNIGLNYIDIIHKPKHCLMIDLITGLTLMPNFIQLWYITVCHYLIIENGELLSIECYQLNLIKVSPLVLNVIFCFLKIGRPTLDQANVLFNFRLIS